MVDGKDCKVGLGIGMPAGEVDWLNFHMIIWVQGKLLEKGH